MARRDTTLVHRGELSSLTGSAHTRLHAMTDALDHSATAYQLFYSDSGGAVQELPHGTSGQVLTSNGASADPSWQTPTVYMANLTDDVTPQLGGPLDVNSQKIVSASNGDIDIEPNGTGNVLLGNFTFDADQTVGAGQDDYVLTYDHATGLISLEAAAGGTSLTNFQDDGLAGEVLYNSAVALESSSTGVILRPSSGATNALIQFRDNGDTARVNTGWDETNDRYIINMREIQNDIVFLTEEYGGGVGGSSLTGIAVRAETATTDALVELYHNGVLVAETRESGGGLNLYSGGVGTTNPQLRFHTNTSLRGIVFYDDSTNQMVLDSRETTDSGFRFSHTGSSVLQTAIESDGTQTLFYYGAETTNVLQTESYGVKVKRGNGTGVGVIVLNGPSGQGGSVNFEEGSSTEYQIQYTGTLAAARHRLTSTGEKIHFTSTPDGDIANFIGNGAVELFYAGNQTFDTRAGGIGVYDDVGDGPRVNLYEDNGTLLGRLEVESLGTTLSLVNFDHGGEVHLDAEDALGTRQNLFTGNPDGEWTLYRDGQVNMISRTGGVRLRGDSSNANPIFEFYDSVGTTRYAYVFANNGGGSFDFESEIHGATVRLLGEDTGGTGRSLLVGDPDGATALYHTGNIAIETQGNGLRTYGHNVANQSEIEMWDASALMAALVTNGSNFVIYSNQNSEHVVLRGKTAAAANQILFEGDPDVGVAFNGSTPFAAPTYSVTNVTTDRTYNANSTTLAELADVLGTLIADLRSYGLVV